MHKVFKKKKMCVFIKLMIKNKKEYRDWQQQGIEIRKFSEDMGMDTENDV